ncbi:hypothetical protein AYI70_g12451 [Smittium culicis]|uniref:Reverse transcriptase domain-containing protein n=1 Tax=Smittium culicis TaxID=133412 RepID=A0A1R1WXF9_9FUNG|nr:hypothetical protein AYI70_g12451 [Smittium culicis]
MPTLNIGFWNCNGLSHFKWEYVMKCFKNDTFDIIFLAETWFVDEDNHKSHPYYIFSSKFDGSTRTNGRCKNGLMCLAKPYIKIHISSVESTTHTLSLCVFGILLGDINTYFGSGFGQKRIRPQDRVDLFNCFSHTYDMNHLRPETDMDTLDHAYISSNISGTWDKLEFSDHILSDHLLMTLAINLTEIPEKDIFDSPEKINLTSINEPAIRYVMLAEYANISHLIDTAVYQIENYVLVNCEVGYGPLIDCYYNFLVEKLFIICSHNLGTYSINDSRSSFTPDTSCLDVLDSPQAASIAARIFKKSQFKAKRNAFIQSRFPSVSAADDVYSYYNDLYKPSTVETESYYVDHSDPITNSIDFKQFFTPTLVRSAILEYPSSKSSGPDPLHISIFKVFVESDHFLDTLTRMFIGFCRYGYTPSSWNVSHIHPIPKEPDSITINQFRPVSLTKTARRIFENCLIKYIETTGLVLTHQSQSGFRKDQSTLELLIATNDILFLNYPYCTNPGSSEKNG